MQSHVITADAGFVYIVPHYIQKSCQADRIDNRLSCHHEASGHAAEGA